MKAETKISLQVQLVLPEDCSERLQQHFAGLRDPPAFYRVIMPLGQVLDGMFFTEYIKKGTRLANVTTSVPTGSFRAIS